MSTGRLPSVDGGIQPTIVDAKGDLIVATAADTVSRLAVGSNNNVLMADSTQSTGLKYAAEATATLTTTGDLLYASAANTLARRAIGSTGDVLTVSGGVPTWAAPSSGSLTLISTTNLSGATTTLSSIPQTYTNLRVVIQGARITSGTAVFNLTFNNNTSGDYPSQMPFNDATVSRTSIQSGNTTSWLDTSNSVIWSSIYVDIMEYANTSYGKNYFVVANFGTTGSQNRSQMQGGLFGSTSAITSIEVKTSASTFNQGRVLLYGVK